MVGMEVEVQVVLQIFLYSQDLVQIMEQSLAEEVVVKLIRHLEFQEVPVAVEL
jgi:hypothetical protein